MAVFQQLDEVLDYVETVKFEARQRERDFDDVRTYCMFIGYPRSGHSLVGSLLDAHPNMIVAHEVDALRCLTNGFENRAAIYHLLLENSREFTGAGRAWNGYSYEVPNQWHGRYRSLQVIGDKKGGASSLQLMRDPQLLDRLQAVVPVPIRFVHVIRNPFDTIATIARLHEVPLEVAIDGFFGMAGSVTYVKQKVGAAAVHDLRHEDFIADPQAHLRALCAFLGQDADADYLKDCASIVFKQPKKTRGDAAWTGEQLRTVQQRIAEYPFLHGYDFEN